MKVDQIDPPILIIIATLLFTRCNADKVSF
jgi:hypothetical protein